MLNANYRSSKHIRTQIRKIVTTDILTFTILISLDLSIDTNASNCIFETKKSRYEVPYIYIS